MTGGGEDSATGAYVEFNATSFILNIFDEHIAKTCRSLELTQAERCFSMIVYAF